MFLPAFSARDSPDHLMHILRKGLRQIQHRSNVIDGCLAGTGLTLTTSRQQGQVTPGCEASPRFSRATPTRLVTEAGGTWSRYAPGDHTR